MQMESLSWCLGQLGPVRPLGSDRPADGPLLSRMAPAPRYLL